MLTQSERRAINSGNLHNHSGFWNDERLARLKELASAGRSAAAIADDLANGCTRNMVVGKARRCDVVLSGDLQYNADRARIVSVRQRIRLGQRIARKRAQLEHFEATLAAQILRKLDVIHELERLQVKLKPAAMQ